MNKIISFNAQYNTFCNKYNDEHIILKFNEQEVSKKLFKERVHSLMAHLIDLGVKKGMGVGYTMPNNIDIIPLFVAISQIGAYAVPLFHMMPDRMKVNIYKETKVRFVITTGKQLESFIEHSKELEADYTMATIDENNMGAYSLVAPLYKKIVAQEHIINEEEINLPLMVGLSSGTTGTSKFVFMTQGNIGEEVKVGMALNEEASKGQAHLKKYMAAFPFSTSVVLVLIGFIFNGTTLIYSDDTSPRNFLKLAAENKVVELSGPPAYFELLLNSSEINMYDLTSVQRVGMGMDFCSVGLIKRLKGALKNLKYYTNGYGLVETCNIYMINCIDISADLGLLHHLHLPSTANNEIEVRNEEGQVVNVGEVGELYVKGPNVVSGYANNVKETLMHFREGWLKTGDIARKESEREITLLGRCKNFIKRGGKSVSPIIVENCINEVKGVACCGVVGIPHPLYGEMIWAFIVCEKGAKVTLRDIKKHCKEILPYYMLPDQVEFIDEIPKNSGVGKVNYKVLREMGETKLKEMLGEMKSE